MSDRSWPFDDSNVTVRESLSVLACGLALFAASLVKGALRKVGLR